MRAKDGNLTQQQLKALLDYDPDTGVFRHKLVRQRTVAGAIAGHLNVLGYIRITIYGRRWMAQRLAWLYVNGMWPEEYVDHINGNRSDNRIANLRSCSKSDNSANQPKLRSNNTSGFPGVSFHKPSKKWVAHACKGRKYKNLGYFLTKQEAYDAYLEFRRTKDGEFFAHT